MALYVLVPRGKIIVANRPWCTYTVLLVRPEIFALPTVALATPHQRTATHVVPAVPVKTLFLRVRTILIVHPELRVQLVQRIISAQYRVAVLLSGCWFSAVREFPRVHVGRGIVLNVLYVSTAFEHQDLQSFFSQLLCCPAAGNSGADNNRVIVHFIFCHCNWGYCINSL